jgi:hypothetical protein
MPQPAAITDWIECVNQAKINLGLPVGGFMATKGPLLREARKLYCYRSY